MQSASATSPQAALRRHEPGWGRRMHLGAGTLKAQRPAVTTNDPGQPGSRWRPWPDLCHCRPRAQPSSLESRVLLANSSVLSRLRTCYLPWISSPNQRSSWASTAPRSQSATPAPLPLAPVHVSPHRTLSCSRTATAAQRHPNLGLAQGDTEKCVLTDPPLLPYSKGLCSCAQHWTRLIQCMVDCAPHLRG